MCIANSFAEWERLTAVWRLSMLAFNRCDHVVCWTTCCLASTILCRTIAAVTGANQLNAVCGLAAALRHSSCACCAVDPHMTCKPPRAHTHTPSPTHRCPADCVLGRLPTCKHHQVVVWQVCCPLTQRPHLWVHDHTNRNTNEALDAGVRCWMLSGPHMCMQLSATTGRLTRC